MFFCIFISVRVCVCARVVSNQVQYSRSVPALHVANCSHVPVFYSRDCMYCMGGCRQVQ